MKFRDKMEKLFINISKERHLLAMRDSFSSVIPFLILSGFVTFINAVLLGETGFVGSHLDPTLVEELGTLFTRLSTGTLGIFSIMLAILIPYHVGTGVHFENPKILSIVSLSVFFIFMPLAQDYSLFGTSGVLIAMIIGLTTSELFMKLSKNEKLKINVEGNIPQTVLDSFNFLITICIMLVGYALVAFALQQISGMEIGDLINTILQKPLVGVAATLPGVILNILVQTGLFAFGIHPAGVTFAVFEPIFTASFETGAIVNVSFRDTYGLLGGTGCTIGLVIAMIFIAKRKEMKAIGKLAAPVSLFNINEPVIFGVPIVYNPIMMIPFILVPICNLTVAYFVTAAHLVSICSTYVTWSTPPIVSAYVASNGDIRNVILQIAIIAMDVVIYSVFLKIYERSLNKQVEENDECVEE